MNQSWPGLVAPPRRTPPLVPGLLREYGDAVQAAVDHYVAAGQAAPYLGNLVADYPRRRGKMMRPAICIAVARAFGARADDAVLAAAGIELFHNALLIHDDIEDGSVSRRGHPTLHAEHGVPLALNAGDALLLLALEPLLDAAAAMGEGAVRPIMAVTRRMARETVEGQALELGWRDSNRTDLIEADYLAMAMKKTAWMSVIWPAQLGALIATQGRCDPEALVRFGFFLGTAFQIQDDLLNLVADSAYGKERSGDLYEAKRTLMLIHALRAAGDDDRTVLHGFLCHAREGRTPAMVAGIADMFERLGSVAHARAVASGLAGAATHEFDLAFGHLPASRDKDFIAGLIPWVFERT